LRSTEKVEHPFNIITRLTQSSTETTAQNS
jgi:hypothetical protein